MDRKNLNQSILKIAVIICLLLAPAMIFGQTPPGPVGVNWVLVTFNQPPTTYTVTKAPLRYNKQMALSFHADDGILDAYTVAFPFFTGIQVGNSNYPGLFYTDGCGNDISFKLSSSIFSFNGISGPDVHAPGNNFNAISWPQLDTMYQNNCAIFNHGVNSENYSDPASIQYSIKRNESYIRRKLVETTPGGVKTKLFVNPNGNINWSPYAFNLGYMAALNQAGGGILGNLGGNVNAIAWNQPYNIIRLQGENTNVPNLVAQMQNLSINGANYWATVFTHSIVNNYPLAKFTADFNAVAATYGKFGSDNLWMSTEEEIINYLTVRDATTLNTGVAGNNLIIMFEGAIPSDMRFHALSLVINADATITNIQVNGGTNNTFTGVGLNQALINLEWEGTYIHPFEVLADSFVTIAEQTQAQFDCWIAMDYVMMVPPGPERSELKLRLCGIPNVQYEDGFCDECEFTLGPDTTICQGYCVTLSAPAGTGYTYLWSTGSTSQSITVCPMQDTTYWVELTTANNCVASDTINIFVLPSPVFDLGEDIEACAGDTVTITGPEFEEEYIYMWYVDGNLQNESSYVFEFVVQDTSVVWLDILTPNTCVASDTVMVNALPSPLVQLGGDISECLGVELTFTYTPEEDDVMQWFLNGVFTGVSDSTFTIIVTDTAEIVLFVTNLDGCTASDTVNVFALDTPLFEFEEDITGCLGDTLTLVSGFDDSYYFQWFVDGEQTGINTPYIDLFIESDVEIKLVVTSQQGCSHTDSTLITAVASPQITVSPQQSVVCPEFPVNLSATVSGATAFSWWDGMTQLNRVVVPQVADTVYHYWAVAVNEFGCVAIDTARVVTNKKPSVAIEVLQGSTVQCAGDTITLMAMNTGNMFFQTIVWNHTDTLDAGNGLIRSFTPMQSQWLVVEVFSTQGCRDADSIYLTTKPSPNVSITASSTEVCQGSPVLLQASGAPSFVWSTGQTATSVTVKPMENTVYWVVGTNQQGCSASDTVTITTLPVEPIVLGGIYPVYCLNDQPTLISASPFGGTLSGPGLMGSMFNPQLAGDGVHYISYHYENAFGCVSHDSVRVTVFGGNTPIDLGTPALICPQEELILDAGSGFQQYYWSTGDTTQTVTISGSDYMPGTFRVISVVGVLSGCTASGSVSVGIRTDCYTDNQEIVIPEAVIIPNPNRGVFLYYPGNELNDVVVRVFDVRGLPVQTFMLNACSNDSPCSINIGEQAAGLYIVTVTAPGVHQMHKMIVR